MNNTIISERSTKPSVLKEFEPSKQPAPIIGRSEINNMTNSNSGWLASMSSMTKLLLLSLIASFAFGAYTFWNGDNDVPSVARKTDSAAITLAADSLKPSLNLDVNRLSQLGIESPGKIASIPIREIRVGMRVPAHNPEVRGQERSSWVDEINPQTWRKFTLDVEKQDGSGSVGVTLLRPSSWLVAESENTNLALLELAVENAAKEWDQTPTWAKTIDELVYSASANAWMDRLSVGVGWGKTTWQYASSGHLVVGVANLGLSEFRSSVAEQASYEAALSKAVADVQTGAGVESQIWLDMPELGAVGFATVVQNEPCPRVVNGKGQVVTATFVHESAEVLDLSFMATGRFSDDARLFPSGIRSSSISSSSSRHQTQDSSLSLGVTSAHPFWSVTRDSFVPAGELLQFEEVVTIDGQIWRLTSITARAGPESVFNFEVAGEHVYYVGSDGLLVHNLYAVEVLSNGNKIVRGAGGKFASHAKGGLTKAVKKADRLAGHGNILNDAPAALYAKYAPDGSFLKWGITKHVDDVYKRYPAKFKRSGGTMEILAIGPRKAMAQAERRLVELMPGIKNEEFWAGRLVETLMRF